MTSVLEEIAELEAVVRDARRSAAERDEALRAIARLNERLVLEAPARCGRDDGPSAFRIAVDGAAYEVCSWHYHVARGRARHRRVTFEVLLERDPLVAMWVAAADVAIELARAG